MALLALIGSATAQELKQADLEKMVRELESIAVKNDKYKYPIECHVLEDEDINAFATCLDPEKPGDKPQAVMAVLTGLVKEVKGDMRLIRAVVAHEVAHLSMGHCGRARYIAKDFENLWTRQQEFEADQYGAELLQRAGYSKNDMVDMLNFLAKLDGRKGSWVPKLVSDHADPKARAAEISDNPNVFRALIQFDVALMYAECRQHNRAAELFYAAAAKEPKLTEAYSNAAQAKLQFYYESMPKVITTKRFRPDFGAMLSEPAVGRDTVVTDEHREKYKDAMSAIDLAIEKTSSSQRALELKALAKILAPDDNMTAVQEGVDELRKLKGADDEETFRITNNLAVGYHRLGKVNDAYAALISGWLSQDAYSVSAAENLGRLRVPKGTRKKEQLELETEIYKVYLANTPESNPLYALVKDAYKIACEEGSIKFEEIEPAPIFLCSVVSFQHRGKNVGLFDTVNDLLTSFGIADLKVNFSEKYKDLNEFRWHGGNLTILTERNQVLRATSYETGSSVTLKSVDESVAFEAKITVGMTEEDLGKILNVNAAPMRELAKGGELENWRYFTGLNLGVFIKDGKVAGITTTSVKVPKQN